MKPRRTLLILWSLCALPLWAAEPIPAQPWENALKDNPRADEKPAEKPEEKKRRAEVMQDNSFLVEEAYNQEPGVVQHSFLFSYAVNKLRGPDDRSFNATFTQEWPVVSQRHQLSYSLPYNSVSTGGPHDDGVGDVFLNYRYQLLFESDTQPAFAPRISVILPTGDKKKGFGNETVGYQINLPVSKVLSDRWTVHFNAGATVLPRINAAMDAGGFSKKRTLTGYNIGASAIFAVTEHFNLMCEFIGNSNEQFNGSGRITRSFAPILSPGMRYGIDLPKTRDAQLVFGVGAPIGLNHTAPDYGVLGYISFEHKF